MKNYLVLLLVAFGSSFHLRPGLSTYRIAGFLDDSSRKSSVSTTIILYSAVEPQKNCNDVTNPIVFDTDGDDDILSNFESYNDDEDFFLEAERDANRNSYPKGKPDGYFVTKTYSVSTFENLDQETGITQETIKRLGLCSENVTLPIALMLLDREEYPSLSRARKACRKGLVVVNPNNRGKPTISEETGQTGQTEFNQSTCFQGRAIDRIYPGGK